MLLPAVIMTKSEFANRLFFLFSALSSAQRIPYIQRACGARSLVTIIVYSHRAIIQHGTHAYVAIRSYIICVLLKSLQRKASAVSSKF